jgi:hypothetical protein
MRTTMQRLGGRWASGILMATLLSTGCTSYLGVHPIQPSFKETVPDLQPTFAWEPAELAGVTYDLGVWAAADKSDKSAMQMVEAYYREGLTTTTHRVEAPLAADTIHTWAVRTRQGETVSDWSRRQTVVFTIITYDKRSGPMRFKTP